MSIQVEPTEKEVLQRALLCKMAQREILAFKKYIEPSYIISDHNTLLAGYLEAVERGEITRLIVTEPPRHGKSDLVSGTFPAWTLGRDNKATFILSSYASDLAEKFSIQVRDTIPTPEYQDIFPGLRVSPNVRSVDRWTLVGQNETLLAAGVGGKTTGFGAKYFIIDDPIKNREEANSLTIQDKVYQFYQTTARTRLTPDGRIIIIMTRWDDNDLVGKILSSDEAGKWVIVHLPAISYGHPREYDDPQTVKRIRRKAPHAFPDPLGRPKGKALWPERGYDEKWLAEQKLALVHEFDALYQGVPTAPEGKFFKLDRIKRIDPGFLSRLAYVPLMRGFSWDLAWSKKQDKLNNPDWTAGLKYTLLARKIAGDMRQDEIDPDVYKMPPVIFLIEAVSRWQEDIDDSLDWIERQSIRDGHERELLIESVALQNKAVNSFILRKSLWKHNIHKIHPIKDKVARAGYTRVAMGAGIIYYLCLEDMIPEWVLDFLDELGDFPTGANDDQVDALTQAMNHCQHYIDHIMSVQPEGVWEVDGIGQLDFQSTQNGFKSSAPPELQENQEKQINSGAWEWV